MSNIQASQIVQYAAYIGILIISGIAEYIKIVPQGTFFPILTLTVGHFFGQQPVVNAVKQTLKNGTQDSASG